MSGLELAALGALGVAYFDARTDLFNDLVRAKIFVKTDLTWLLMQKQDRVSVFNTFEYFVKKYPHKTFLVYPEPIIEPSTKQANPLEDSFIVRRYTYDQVHKIVQKISAYLVREHDIHSNDVVAIYFVNKPEMVFVWFALWNIGAVPAMLNYNLVGKSLIHCIKVSKSKLLVIDSEVAENGLAVADELRNDLGVSALVADKDLFENVDKGYSPLPFTNKSVIGSDPACYIFTSGTTGLPKAATMSWKKANWGASLYSGVCYYSTNDILYSAMPLYHSTAAVLGLLGILHHGGTYAIGHKFSTTTFWSEARLVGATAIQYVGETGRYLLNAPERPSDKQHKVKVAHGNGMRPDVWQRFKDRFNIPVISEFYAATESPSAITNYQRGAYAVGACGSYGTVANFFLKRKWNIAAVDQDTQELWRDPRTGIGREVRPNEPGEFLFKVDPKNIKDDFQGYVGNEAATNEKLAFDVFKKGDAYFRSGDLLKTDKYSNVYFVDRLGDTFRWKSENVSTNEVEEALTDIPNVDVCVCVGVKVPRHEGRAGFAVIKLRDPEKKLDMDALGKTLLSRLPRYAVPIFIKFVGDVGSTGNNKIQKKAFRDQKIPAPPGETIWWLEGTAYKPLTPESWARIEHGHHKL